MSGPRVTDTGRALRDTLISPNEIDRNLEAANVVDGLYEIARAIRALADAVNPEAAEQRERRRKQREAANREALKRLRPRRAT